MLLDTYAFQQACEKLNILVIGDLMVDRYLWGAVERISPEAPVPVVDISKEENRLGGAANVALNIQAIGARPVLCGVVGVDKDGEILRELAENSHFQTDLIFPSTERRTTVKVRVIGNQQQVLRVDKEDRYPLSQVEKEFILPKLLERISDFDAIIFEDYDKSMLGAELIQKVIAEAQRYSVPTLVDPKFKQFWDYAGVTVFKPNMKELNEGLGLRLHKQDMEGITSAIKQLREKMPHHQTLITLSENGMLLVDENFKAHHFPAHYRNITDVSGAGDTVIGVTATAMAAGMPLPQAVAMANLAGGLVCEEVGVVPVNRVKLMEEVMKLRK
ncbi:MAG: D-glycero-beta-D-manno-heptose-7-phosphate kinase [Bacteroidota bacterium]